MNMTRRHFLRAGASLIALPSLISLLPRAARAASTTPQRLILFFTPNGIYMPNWTPPGSGGALPAVLPTILSPLAGLKDQVTVVTGLNNQAAMAQYQLDPPAGDGKDHHAMSSSTLFTGQVTFPGNPGADAFATVDQIAASTIGSANRFPSLQLGLPQTYSCDSNDRGPFNCAHMQNLSWANSDTPLHAQTNPQAVFDLMFSSLSTTLTPAAAEQRRVAQKSVLDAVTREASALSLQLSTGDRAKLDQYLTGVRQLEQQLSATAVDCSQPALLAGSDLTSTMQNFNSLIATAFQCDMTRVVTFMMDSSKSARNYNFLGVPFSHHERSHSNDSASLTKIDTWEVAQYASLLKKLSETRDAAGPLLDNTAALFVSEISTGGNHDPTNLPVVVGGRAGGALTPGRHVALQGGPDIAGLHAKLLQAVGANVATFGQSRSGPIAI